MKKYATDADIRSLVEAFESGTVSRDAWKHVEHMIVALYYLERCDLETATMNMRDGIFNLLKAFGVDLTKEMPYHETMTVFWMRVVSDFNASNTGRSTPEKVRRMVKRFDKEYPMNYYSRELLFSERARKTFVEPDLRPLTEPLAAVDELVSGK